MKKQADIRIGVNYDNTGAVEAREDMENLQQAAEGAVGAEAAEGAEALAEATGELGEAAEEAEQREDALDRRTRGEGAAESEELKKHVEHTASFEKYGAPAIINGEENIIWFNAQTKQKGAKDVLFYEFGVTPMKKEKG